MGKEEGDVKLQHHVLVQVACWMGHRCVDSIYPSCGIQHGTFSFKCGHSLVAITLVSLGPVPHDIEGAADVVLFPAA